MKLTMIGSNLITITICCLIAGQFLTALHAAAAPSDELINDNDATATTDNHQKHQQQSPSLFETLWAPFRSTIKQARSLFGSGLEVTQDRIDDIRSRAFQIFLRAYNKTYSAEELPRRMALYMKRMQAIEQSVKMFQDGKETFRLKPNRFLDWDESELNMLSKTNLPAELEPEEIENANGGQVEELETEVEVANATESGRHKREIANGIFNSLQAETKIPAQFSWRDSGCDAAPIDQGTCGSCYAVSTMSAVETTRCINMGSGATLSKQQVVDCGVRQGYNIHGCDGGWPTSVFKYLQQTRSVARESCYPYRLQNAKRHAQCSLRSARVQQTDCKVNPSLQASRPIQYKVLHNENDILYHVAKTGPVVTVIQTTDKLLYYGDGVMEDKRCRGGKNEVDHAITIVGYGKENGVDYWEIKNSWGTEWGDAGYAKIRRGRNMCSIGRWGWVMTG